MSMTYEIKVDANGNDIFIPLKTNCLCAEGKYFPLNTVCANCNGTKKEPTDKRKKCKTCDGVGKTRSPETCLECGGDWEMSVDATLYDSVPAEFVASIPMKVIHRRRDWLFAESCLGLGIGSVTDYGRHKELTDKELINHIHENLSFCQAIKIVRKHDNVLCDYIAIMTADQGYSIIPVWEE